MAVRASAKLMTMLPARASPKPANRDGDSGSRQAIQAKSATQSGEVATSATELATEVYSREVIQVAKWTARNSPEAAAQSQSESFRPAISLR